jgi:cytidylate kinase
MHYKYFISLSMIVTIDGPAGAGKSSVAKLVAGRLGFRFLDTGAMYRAVTLAALKQGFSVGDSEQISALALSLNIELRDSQTLLNGEDVSAAIRTPEVASQVYLAADNPDVRRHLVDLQRQWAGKTDTVAEGRDQGTVAFPHAECKIFLTASAAERARRRYAELTLRGEPISYEEVLAQQNERDQRDAARPVGALQRAADSIEVVTDGLTTDEVVEKLVEIVQHSRSLSPPRGVG